MSSDTTASGEVESPGDRLVTEGSEWVGISTAPHRFNAVEFNLGEYEIGHVHGSGTLDINFPKQMRDVLIKEDRANEHHYVPDSGWITFEMDAEEDVAGGRWLLRVSYLYRALTRRNDPTGREVLETVDVATELDELDVSDSVREIFQNVTEIERQ